MKIDNYKLIIGNATDVGQVRQINEDYLAHFDTSYGYCIVVCDGMGGHAAGDVASHSAIEAIKHYLQDGKLTKLNTPLSLQSAIEFANFKLREMVALDPALNGMGTTCVIALISNNQLYVAHAGDSRLYLFRNNKIEFVTKDHSTVQQLIDAKLLTEEEAMFSEKRNQITKAIGIFEKVDPNVTKTPIQLKQNDRILLCSDGLTTHVNSQTLLKSVALKDDVQTIATKLVEKANRGGGYDNITVQLIQYTGQSSTKGRKRRIIRIMIFVMIMAVLIGLGYYGNLKFEFIGNHDSVDTIQNKDSTFQTPAEIKSKKTPLITNRDKVNQRNPSSKDTIENPEKDTVLRIKY